MKMKSIKQGKRGKCKYNFIAIYIKNENCEYLNGLNLSIIMKIFTNIDDENIHRQRGKNNFVRNIHLI